MQVVDANGNVFGQGLEITGIDGKPKVPVINTDITIGTTVINGGVSGRLLFDDAGVVGETNGAFWDKVNSRMGFGTVTPGYGISHIGTIGVAGIFSQRDFGFGAYSQITQRASYIAYTTDGTTGLAIGATSGTARIQGFNGLPATSDKPIFLQSLGGNVGIGTTTDAGFKLDVNGTARVVNQFQVGSFTVGGAGASSTIVTTGRISAGGGITLYNPASGDNQDTGIFPSGGVLIKHANSSVATFATVGGGSNGTNVAINQGYNPGAGTGSVIGYSHNYSLYPSADNTISYTSFYSRAFWNSAPYYNRITGQIRGFLFDNSLYNTQKLIDVVAFYANGGRLLFTGNLPAASVTSGVSRGLYLNQTHTASANNDVLVGLDISPTYTLGAFTGVTTVDLRTNGANVTIGSSYGYGALYGYANDGLVQIKTAATYKTQMWFRPSGNASGYNASYWSRIEHDGGTLNIIGSSYGQLSIASANGNSNGARIYFSGATGVANNALSLDGPANSGRIALTTYGSSPITINGGNLLIGTTTDAGYKLDVNGTARVSGNITQAGANTAALGYITNGTLGVYSNAPGTGTVGILVGCVSNGGHTAIFTKGNNSGSTALRVTDQNVGASVNHLMVDFVGATGFGIANGTTVVNSSAQVEIQSTTKGFLPPRMTNTEMLAIATPAAGLIVYDTTNNKHYGYDGTTWNPFY